MWLAMFTPYHFIICMYLKVLVSICMDAHISDKVYGELLGTAASCLHCGGFHNRESVVGGSTVVTSITAFVLILSLSHILTWNITTCILLERLT